MTELASIIGVTRQAISQYELGSKQPMQETMLELISALKLPISYFTTERPSGGRSGTVFFRSFKSRRKTDNKRYDIKKQWVGQIAHYLANLVNYPRVDLPEFEPRSCEYTDDEIEELANRCRRHWNLGDGPISNVVTLLESKGVITTRSRLVSNVFGYSCWHDDQRPLVFLGESRGSAVRSRFDAAHELAHLLMHDGITAEQLEDPKTLDQVEREANRFAGAFLLPASSFPFEIFHHSLAHFIELKKRWRSSIAAMIMRCEQLGIFDEDRILRMRKQLGPYRKNEPLDSGPNSIGFEHPTLLGKALELVFKSGVRTPADVLSDLRLPPTIIADFCGVAVDLFSMPEPEDVVVHLKSGASFEDQECANEPSFNMSKPQDRTVSRRPNGVWENKRNDADRASSLHSTQREAQQAAKQMLQHQGGGEVTTKGRKGLIVSKDTVAPGKDPNPPRDTEH